MLFSKLLRRIALLSAVLGGGCALALALLFGLHSGLSSLVGTALGVINLWVLARLVTRLLDGRRSTGRRGRAAVLLGAKAIALVTLVGVLVVNGWVKGGALMAGFSMVALSMVLGGLWQGTEDDTSTAPDDLSTHTRE